MKQGRQDSGGIEFIPAICPNCGGELRVPKNREKVKCLYCGCDVILQDPNKITIELKKDIDNLLVVAKTSLEGKNFQEAYQYYTQVLEQNPNLLEAWLGKGYAAGMMSKPDNLRIDEAKACFDKVLYAREQNKDNHIMGAPFDVDPSLAPLCAKYLYEVGNKIKDTIEVRQTGDLTEESSRILDSFLMLFDSYVLQPNEVTKLSIIFAIVNRLDKFWYDAHRVKREIPRAPHSFYEKSWRFVTQDILFFKAIIKRTDLIEDPRLSELLDETKIDRKKSFMDRYMEFLSPSEKSLSRNPSQKKNQVNIFTKIFGKKRK